MTISQSLKFAADKLTAKKINLPHLEAEILLSEILKKPREFILAHGERELTKPQITDYKLLIKKRLKGMPIAYIAGEKEFYGLKFKINKNVLIPRPETELMVEEALKLITRNSQPATLIDVGTGSGCVIITLAKILCQESKIKNYQLWGTDISAKALAVARQNASAHNVCKKIKFLKGNLLEPLVIRPDECPFGRVGRWDLVILANLPYLTPSQIKNSPSIKHEPRLALAAGPDGLKYYRQLFKQLRALRVKGYALCEIDPSQTAKIKQLIKHELPGATLQIKKDLSGLNRLVIIKF